MARPARLEIAGAVYLISAHCPFESRRPAFADEADRAEMRGLLAQALHRFDAQALAYALLPEHYRLLLFTRRANLSQLMRHVNGVYTQHHQRRWACSGPLFQGRFHAVLVDRERHLLDACRFVDLEPVRLGLARGAADWAGSSFRALAGLEAAPEWLEVDGLHAHLLGRQASTAAQRRQAGERYARLVASEPGFELWPGRLREQIFLGDAGFAARMRALAVAPRRTARRSWAEWLKRASGIREQALWLAHTEGGVAMTALAGQLGLSVSRVSRLIAAAERAV
ncbi:transposase [Roseateles saccharophilus]|uniref:REP element-mobilizing transposase RayT n=1 Tax=Roseateles saccharophilus TaxID=304 RepID=A0A4R3VA03_ROSSA|nr:transposase [Roseateles saccharophilus]MDG0832964.1 transposase [Roseateles saccharophilus]TCV02056.1 REP element-mobilizing transposase RayT [Roseateles saccharophilus]